MTATLAEVFPRITLEAPRDASGQVIDHALSDEAFDNDQGVLGHYHVQPNKTDPGPAFQWDRGIGGAKRLVGETESHGRPCPRPRGLA